MFHTSQKQYRFAKAAFTFGEFLIVMATVAVFAAILLPVWVRTSADARRNSCQSNLKQIGLAFEQYKAQYNGLYPSSVLNSVSWSTRLVPYLKSPQVFVCPAASSVATVQTYVKPAKLYYGVSALPASLGGLARNSYGRNSIYNRSNSSVNPNFSGWVQPKWGNGFSTDAPGNLYKTGFAHPTTQSGALAASDVEDPTGTIFIFDNMALTQNENLMRSITNEVRTDHFPTATASKVSARHFGGFYALYGDGHVKWLKWGSTKAEAWTIQND